MPVVVENCTTINMVLFKPLIVVIMPVINNRNRTGTKLQ